MAQSRRKIKTDAGKHSRTLLGVFALLLVFALPKLAHADDKDVIEYREHIMNALNAQAAALGMILSGAIPDDNASAHLEIIAGTASIALKAFEPKVPGGEAKPQVWSDWADFSKRMNEFAARTKQAARLAQEKGSQAGLANVLDALTCKNCHDVYRQEKKK
jgi:cytochrome c556